jgi:hypothetical protein
MAKVVIVADEKYIYGRYDWMRVGLTGAALGVILFAVAWMIGSFVIDPLVCRSGTLTACGRSEVIAANVAGVIVAVIGASVLIRLLIRRALGVALAALLVFWNITTLTAGLQWAEATAWLAVFYALTYLLFASIFRIKSLWVSLVVAAIVVLALRWVAFL